MTANAMSSAPNTPTRQYDADYDNEAEDADHDNETEREAARATEDFLASFMHA